MKIITLSVCSILFAAGLSGSEKTGLAASGTIVMKNGKTVPYKDFASYIRYSHNLDDMRDAASTHDKLAKRTPEEIVRIDYLNPTPKEQAFIEKSVRCGGTLPFCDVRKVNLTLLDGTTDAVFIWSANGQIIGPDNQRYEINSLKLKSVISSQSH